MIQKTKLSVDNEKQLKKIFKEAFPQHLWSKNVPFPEIDEVYIFTEDEKIVGFCMVHGEPPHATSEEEKGSYMYNLCVAKSHRNQGVATALLEQLIKDHLHCYLHMPKDHPILGWITRHGWQLIGPSLHEMIEYSYGFPAYASSKIENQSNQHYDADENVVYL